MQTLLNVYGNFVLVCACHMCQSACEYMCQYLFYICVCLFMCLCTSVHICTIPYKQIYWQVEYLANRLVIVVGVILTWQKAVAMKLYGCYLNLADTKIAKPPN